MAFLERRRSRRELNSVVSLIEENFSALKERQKDQPAVVISSGRDPRNTKPSRNVPANSRSHRCWNSGYFGHVRRNCRQKAHQPGNGQTNGGRQTPGQEH